MEVEKRGVKGGFFQLFDWNGKSRKKLFSNKSDLPENSNNGKDDYHGSIIARRQLACMKALENDYPEASLASVDFEQSTKAPGVVARLMGLDSLPTSNVNEPNFNPFTDPHSFRDPNYLIAAPAFHTEHDIVIFESVRNKLDGSSRNPLDMRLQKGQNRHLERFQREALPPKSAKPMPVAHNRLLSPIRSPGFIPPKNATYIIEAAAKIIEQSPRSNTKGNFSSLGSPSIQFRARNLKEKMDFAEQSQKGKEENPKNIKKQLNSRGKGRLEENYMYKGSEESRRVSAQRLKSREKSAPPKSKIQKKDGSNSSRTRGFDKPNTQKKVESSTRRPSDVLKLNNQKQNCASSKDEDLEPSCSHSKERQDSIFSNGRTNRTVNKVIVNDVATSRKTNFVAADPGRDVYSSRAKSALKKRLPTNGNNKSSGIVAQKATATKDEKSVKCNLACGGDSKWDGKGSSDVVSFTFTSPIKKSNSSSVAMEATSSLSLDYDRREGFDFVGGDALSLLLEQKLKELTSKIELSSFANNYESVGPTDDLVEPHLNNGACKRKSEADDASDCVSADKIWASKGLEFSGGSTSLLSQPSLSGASSDSFDVDRSSNNEGPMACSSLDSCVGMNWRSTTKPHQIEGDQEISDTASSLSLTTSEAISSTPKDSSNWELKYIEEILSHVDLMPEEFSLGQANNIVSPTLFIHLENQKMDSYVEENLLERRVLFDCVCECLESRFGRIVDGGFEFWGKKMSVLRRLQFLGDDLWREVLGWMNVDEMMVDELVEKDMSSKGGKWVDFEIEAFEEGVEIGDRMLTCLVDELIDDFLL